METSSKLKVNHSEDIRHQVHIFNIPLSSFKKKKGNYSLKVKKKYTYQKAVVKIKLGASIIENKQHISGNFFTISFDDESINIFIEKLDADKVLIKSFGRYRISYLSDDTDELSIKVKSSFKQTYYNNVFLPLIRKVKKKEEHAKAKGKNKGSNADDDLRRRDFHFADKFPYHHSPNSDGSRSRNEVFGGAFSGGSRSGGKRKGR